MFTPLFRCGKQIQAARRAALRLQMEWTAPGRLRAPSGATRQDEVLAGRAGAVQLVCRNEQAVEADRRLADQRSTGDLDRGRAGKRIAAVGKFLSGVGGNSLEAACRKRGEAGALRVNPGAFDSAGCRSHRGRGRSAALTSGKRQRASGSQADRKQSQRVGHEQILSSVRISSFT